MKLLSKITLQWRITILTAIILLISSLSLTMFSIYTADTIYLKFNTSTVPNDSTVPDIDNIKIVTPKTDNIIITKPKLEAKKKFDTRILIFLAVLDILATIMVYFVTGKALKPVRKLSKEVAYISSNNLSYRIPASLTKDEVGKLTDSFNKMLNQLEEAFERQKRFTANAAHELKTPLATIKASIQVLQLEDIPSLQDYKETTDITNKSIERLSKVVDDLLLLASKGESEENDKEVILLEPMIEIILQEIYPLYIEKNITYNIDCKESTIYGNATLLYRALANLLENAHKYNVKNGSITISAKENNNITTIIISDTGIGIPDSSRKRIFEPFYRVDKSRSRKIAGAGLGLSLTKTIIEKDNGEIYVEKNKSGGTDFILILPSLNPKDT